MPRQPKPKACRCCGAVYQPISSIQVVCSPPCALNYSKRKLAKKQAQAYRRDEAAKRDSRQGSTPMNAAQRALNEFVKIRDADQPCIVHGEMCPNTEFDAGHFMAVGMGGGSPLRLNCWNVHKQCRPSNRGAHNRKRYRNTVPGMYRENLVERIGRERVEWLEGPHAPRQYREEYLTRFARIFRKRTRLYQRLRGM